jgi:hypothetical protein
LDDYGGITGKGTASFMKDDGGPSSHRIWKLCPANDPYFIIVSTNGVALDDWDGATGKGAASQAKDDSEFSKNRSWHFIPSYNLKVVLSDFVYEGDVEEILNSHNKVDLMSEHIVDVA